MGRMHRALNFEGMLNARDLGGLPVGGAQTRWKSLVRSDSTARLTPRGTQAIVDYGIRTVIDLRFPVELQQNPSSFASNGRQPVYHCCSLLGESWPNWVARGAQSDESYWYSSFLDCSQPEMRRVLELIADAPAGGVLFHCTAGKDRTGVAAMLLLALAGVPDEAIATDYAMTAPNLAETRRQELEGVTDPAARARIEDGFRCEPAFAVHTLAHLRRRYGGAAGYMQTVGLDAARIERLRARLV